MSNHINILQCIRLIIFHQSAVISRNISWQRWLITAPKPLFLQTQDPQVQGNLNSWPPRIKPVFLSLCIQAEPCVYILYDRMWTEIVYTAFGSCPWTVCSSVSPLCHDYRVELPSFKSGMKPCVEDRKAILNALYWHICRLRERETILCQPSLSLNEMAHMGSLPFSFT